ncbi:tape measure protein [Bifidobacterium pseudolongum]|uniref:Phage tail protein n=1 Tax=Bifidobacterium pseudolongum subsp. globosum TaxID=1690 RepID=A0A2N3QTN8_9BIFI|nr:tape measure protein [Bifidobacterium pseudolongum]PKU95366.1 phage tail protein [Bifidobacterium pseudolongum subsp. globosum]PKV00149.1 phage tail protein [Bifidobacterium pseudolongum subsp. globosum]
MAIKLAEAYVQIVPSMKGVGNAIVSAFDGASGKAGLSGGKAAGSGFAGGLKAKMGAVIGAASAITSKAMDAIGSSISSAVSRADQMNNFPKVMQNLGYSSEDAAKSIKKISDSLDGLPTTSSAMTGMVQQLAPLTSNLDEATTISLAFNNAMLAGGASTMEQENALAQYTQMLSAGTVDMAAWRSIQAAMPGQLNQVAEAMMGAGHNANDLYEAMKDGTYSFDDFNQAIVDLNQNGFGQYASFAQQAKDATQGIGTAIENVKNRVAKAVQKVVEAFGVENIAGAINGFSSQFGKIGDAAASMVTFTKDQFSLLWDRVKDLGAIDTLKTAWDGLTAKLSNTDWGSLLPSGVWGQLRNTAASALADVMDRVSQLIDWLSNGIQWVADFARSFADTGVFDAWIDVFGVVLDVINSATDVFGSVIDAIGRMTGAAGGAQSFGQTVGDAFKTIADLIKPVLQVLDDVLGWFSRNPGVIVAALGTIGTAFAGVKGYQALNNGLQVLKGTMDTVTGAAKGVSNGIQLMMDLGGPVQMLKQMGGQLNIVKNAQTAWSAATKAATAVQGAFNAIIAANPIGAIITAIAAVVAALVWFFTQTETGRKAWAAFTQWLGDAWNKVCEVGKAVWEGLANFFSGLWDGISSVAQSVWGGISSFFTGIWDGVSSVWNTVWNGVQTVFEAVWGFIQAYVQNVIMPIGEFIKNCFIVIAAVFVTIWNGIKTVWETVWNAIVAFFTPIIQVISDTITTVCTFISETWNTVWTAVSGFFQSVWNGIVAFFTPIIEGIATMISTVVAAIQATWDAVWGAISSFFQNIWNGIVAFFTPIITGIRNTITNAVNAIRSTWTSVWNSISSFFSGIWNGMRNAVGNAVGFIGDKVRGIKDTVMGALSGAGSWLFDTGKDLIQGLINGIGDMFGWVRDKICSLGDNILGWAKGVLGIGSPSKIFAQYGRWLDEGLAIGIGDAAGQVGKAMDDMTGMVIDLGLDLKPDGGYYPPNVRPITYSGTESTYGAPRGSNVTVQIDAQGLNAQELFAVFDTRTRRATSGWGME